MGIITWLVIIIVVNSFHPDTSPKDNFLFSFSFFFFSTKLFPKKKKKLIKMEEIDETLAQALDN